MKDFGRLIWLGLGLVLGLALTAFFMRPSQSAFASSGDHFEDYIMCTGAVGITPRAPTDGLWMVDYRRGKLLATIIDRAAAKIIGWSEMDLVQEFGIQPRQDVHFMMTTGNVSQGQAALYLVEVNSGQIGVYTLGPAISNLGFSIRRQDLSKFREGVPVPGGQANGIPLGGGMNGEEAPPRTPNLMPFVGPRKG